MRSNASRLRPLASLPEVFTAIPGDNHGRAGPHQLAVDVHDAGIAGLNRPELRVIANLRQLQLRPIDHVDQPLPGLRRLLGSIDDDLGHEVPTPRPTSLLKMALSTP